jgi:hypothetical protein
MTSAPETRPWWVTVLFVVCAVGLAAGIVRDLLIPSTRDVEVWFGFDVTGWPARLSAPIHWAILAAGAWGFWYRRSWMWPWASLYVFYVALSHLIWSEASVHGRGWPIGLIQAVAISAIAGVLWRARSVFQSVEVETTSRPHP